mmetsp:Transcript_9660/g.39756  ORF Transcript_9660/g.39756 Transcript_9660/m.39756 type:complete len:211 (-) Transcript_9660:43-675(-)
MSDAVEQLAFSSSSQRACNAARVASLAVLEASSSLRRRLTLVARANFSARSASLASTASAASARAAESAATSLTPAAASAGATPSRCACLRRCSCPVCCCCVRPPRVPAVRSACSSGPADSRSSRPSASSFCSRRALSMCAMVATPHGAKALVALAALTTESSKGVAQPNLNNSTPPPPGPQGEQKRRPSRASPFSRGGTPRDQPRRAPV